MFDMSQDRLNKLAVISIEYTILRSSKYKQLINDFTHAQSCQTEIFKNRNIAIFVQKFLKF